MMFEGITIDHKIPRSLHAQYTGNIHETDNLQLVCPACNSMKGQRTLAEFLKELRERNDYILHLSQHTPVGEVISPIYPRIGIGIDYFGDKSAKKYNTRKPKKSPKPQKPQKSSATPATPPTP
jgi:hypothetical protein